MRVPEMNYDAPYETGVDARVVSLLPPLRRELPSWINS